jgi:hypothetical protein
MTNRALQSELPGLIGRFLLLLFFLLLTYPIGPLLLARLAAPRLTAGSGDGPEAETRLLEIVSPLNGFTEGPKQIPRPGDPPKPDDSWVRPGERLIHVPNAPEGSYPMVEGVDGRLYQLSPGGGRHPVDGEVLMRWAAERDGLETELIQEDADGTRELVKLRRWYR